MRDDQDKQKSNYVNRLTRRILIVRRLRRLQCLRYYLRMAKFQAENYPLTLQVIDGKLCVYSPDFDCWLTERHEPNQMGQIEMLVREMWNRKIPSLAHRMSALDKAPPPPSKLRELELSTDDWLSTSDAARLLGISKDSLRRVALSGEIGYRSSPGGHRSFLREDVIRLKESLFEAPQEIKSVDEPGL